MHRYARTLLTVALAVAGIGVVSAQGTQPMSGETTPVSQPGAQNTGSSMQGMDHGLIQGMDHDSMKMQDGSAPPDVRGPDAYSGGYQLSTDKYMLGDPRHMMMIADAHNFGLVLVGRLEQVYGNDANATAYELQARFGNVYNKVALKAEGGVSKGRFEEVCTGLLWSHTVTAFWDTQLGMRNDTGFGRLTRDWVAFGVQGLVPYWFDVEATAYVGNSGRTTLRLFSEYELLLTQRLILQPRIEVNFYGKRDPDFAVDNGLSNATVGLWPCYEFSRQFTPYIGVERSQAFGGTANMIEAADGRHGDTYFVADVRL